jgi:hypothetical protein
LVSLSASVAGFIEATFDTNEEKNALAIPIQMTDTPADYPQAMLGNVMNRMLWSQNPAIIDFLNTARLDPAQRMRNAMADVSENVLHDAGQIRSATMAALPNLKVLVAKNHRAERKPGV